MSLDPLRDNGNRSKTAARTLPVTLTALTLSLALLDPQGQPLKPPFDILPAPIQIAEIEQRAAGSESKLWADGETLTIVHKSISPVIMLMGGISSQMKKLPGSDWHIFQAKMPGGWSEALLSAGFYSPENPRIDPNKLLVFRGDKAPAPAEKASAITGKIEQRDVQSAALGEARGISVYLPPNGPKENIPAFYMADGQGAEGFAKVLEPLILANKIRPVAIVGVHSGSYKGDRTKPYDPKLDDRGRDYVYTTDPAWFDKHMAFFTKEVPAYVQKEFGISANRSDRAVFGFSNGGAFTAALSVKEPAFAANTIPLSVGVPPAADSPKPSSPMPRMFLAAGTLEPGFLKGTTAFFNQVKGWGADATMDSYVGGHDPLQWERVVAESAPKIFPPLP